MEKLIFIFIALTVVLKNVELLMKKKSMIYLKELNEEEKLDYLIKSYMFFKYHMQIQNQAGVWLLQ